MSKETMLKYGFSVNTAPARKPKFSGPKLSDPSSTNPGDNKFQETIKGFGKKSYGPEKLPASYAQMSRWRDEKKTLPSRRKKNDNPLINVRKSYQE